MKYIAFICGHNSGRSQMAQACFNNEKRQFPDVDKDYEAYSFGTTPGTEINQRVVQTLQDIGINLSDDHIYFPKDSGNALVQKRIPGTVRAFTMGCMDKECPVIPELKVTGDWDLADPAEPETDVQTVRDSIIGRCRLLLSELRKEAQK